MQLDTENQIANYNRYHTRDIHTTIRTLSPERKQALLKQIQDHKIMYSLLDKEYNHTASERIESLLNGKRPRNKNNQHRRIRRD